jgi:D-aminopeptidase
MPDPRWRDIAGPVGVLPTGPGNRITDVPGVRVGHSQAGSGEKTGVTIVAPPELPAPAAVTTVNGVGELTANLEINERGRMETPVYLCGSHAIGTVLQAAISLSGRGPENIVLPVVGECDDGEMADSRTVGAGDVRNAADALGHEVAEGTVGAGTGMTCFDFPGGIGTASRRVGDHTVGVLLLCNFGDREYLDLFGHSLDPAPRKADSHGSCIAVCATDAPLSTSQLRRLSLRPQLGLARAGSYGAEGSGEIGVAFATSEGAGVAGTELNPLLAAAWEAGHEAVYNCLVAARPSERRDGSMQEAFPVDLVRQLAERRSGAAGDP